MYENFRNPFKNFIYVLTSCSLVRRDAFNLKYVLEYSRICREPELEKYLNWRPSMNWNYLG